MPTAFEAIDKWIDEARAKLENGGLQKGDLDQLHQIISANRKGTRQRLLYLHASTPGIRSQVIGMALHEPVEGSVTEIVVEEQEWPYNTVHDAILDGWQVIIFRISGQNLMTGKLTSWATNLSTKIGGLRWLTNRIY